MRNPYSFQSGRDIRSEGNFFPDIKEDISDPEVIHSVDKYDSDYIWDGESMDEEKQ